MSVIANTTQYFSNWQTFQKQVMALSITSKTLLGLWLLSMMTLPIALQLSGPGVLPSINWWSVTALAGFMLSILWQAWGAQKTVVAIFLIVASTWALEYVGSQTGLPFGQYHYTNVLQPQIGHVPLLIPLAWLMMMPAAWGIGAAITRRWQGWQFILTSALALTAWDLFLDPQMVQWGFWEWDQPGAYLGIPILNYFGWILAGILVTVLVRPAKLPLFPLLLIYGLTLFFEAVGLVVFFNIPIAALVGTLGMGSLFFIAVRNAGSTVR